MNKEEIELLNKCDNCKLKECIACEFTYTDIQKIKKYVEETESILDKVTDKLKEDIEIDKVEWYEDGKITEKQFKAKNVNRKEYAREILNIIEEREEK